VPEWSVEIMEEFMKAERTPQQAKLVGNEKLM